MQSTHLILFANSRPFEAFTIFVADGRTINVLHPETLLLAEYALGIWIFHAPGQLEIVDAELITALRTVGPVDPREFLPLQRE